MAFSNHKSFSLEGKRMAFELWKAKVSLATITKQMKMFELD